MIFSSTQTAIPVRLYLGILLILAGGWAPKAYGHKVASASLILYLNTEDERTFSVSTQMEVESSGDPSLDDEISPEMAAKTFVENQLLLLIDEKEQPHNLTTELVSETDEDTPEELQRLSVLVTWNGKLPDDGKELSLFLKETSEMSIVIATVKNGTPARRLQVMFAGEYSRAENIEPILKGDPFDKENSQTEETSTSDKEPEEDAGESPENAMVAAIKSGAAAMLYQSLLPLILVLSFVILKGTLRALAVPFVIFLISESLGIALTSRGVIPAYPWSLTVCVGVLFLLSCDNMFSFKFRLWRYLAGIAGGFFLGNAISQSGYLLQLGGSPTEARVLLFFQLGYNAINLIAILAMGTVITLFSRYSLFRTVFVIPISIAAAGLAVFLYLQGNTQIEELLRPG
ncbi:MAG: hypothetical protein P1V20_20545 [Verrucomicrobiales bacterium]|nr:hypothetical protein [Verrucomicrobiales bacterium]